MIEVTSAEFGVHQFDADNYEVDQDGRLWIGEDDDHDATFNVGQWAYVQFIGEDEQAQGLRVWRSVADIPLGVRFADVDGDEFQHDHEQEKAACAWLDDYQPFTEVV